MRRGKGKIPAFMATALAIAVLASAAWAGISSGVLNNSDYDVDLSKEQSYSGGSAVNEIILEGAHVTLTQNLTLGYATSVVGYAPTPLTAIKPGAAGGAIFVGEGQTLNIRPAAGKNVRETEGTTSSLRLFGGGTTNLSGANNRYSETFVQSGRLNVENKAALGGSKVTLAGGASLGLTDNASALDLTGVTINVMRFDASGTEEKNALFDTGTRDSNQMTIGNIKQLTKDNAASGGEITLVKSGSGTLTLTGAPEHTGGTVIEKGTLSLGVSPTTRQTVEIKGGATLSTTAQSLSTVTIKPHSDSYISVQRIRKEAKAQLADTGEAALFLEGINDSELMTLPFRVNANLAAVTKPAGADADLYYVKLLSAPAHGLSVSDVTVEGFVPSDFSTSYYSVRTTVDDNNIYAVLSKDISVYGAVDVTVIRAGSSATAKAIVGENGRAVRFDLWDSNDVLIQTKTAVTSAGEAYSEFTGLSNGRYRVIATVDGRRPGEKEFLIDGTIDALDAFSVLLYDSNMRGLINAAISNNSNTPFPDGNVTFKYSFIAGSPYIDGEATPNTFFTAKNVEFNENRTKALFQIDLGKLTADDGKSYILAAGKTYSIKVDVSAATGNIGSGSSQSQTDSDGILPPASQSYSMEIDTEITGSTIKSSAMIALDNKPIQDGTIVVFSLLDRFGGPMKIPGTSRDYSEWTNAASGSASVKDGFTNVPAGRYVVSVSSPEFNLVAYSDQVEISGGGGGGGGCDAGWGAFALFAAGAAVIFRNRRRED
ncbi:MAG: autotransporter-associated beta strand repeat-containing protein [Synergistaceae bacterium]|nr:autotransporter-associated beta strand repeat-containing protein [Synergistaceae bacterium]